MLSGLVEPQTVLSTRSPEVVVTKKFFNVCAGLSLLALSYHLGARTAGAQASGDQLVDIAWRRADGYGYAVTSSSTRLPDAARDSLSWPTCPRGESPCACSTGT